MTRTRFTRKSIVRPRKRQALADPILAGYAKQIRGLAKRTVNDIIKIGALLTKAKFGWSADTARNFVNVFELSRTSKFRNFRNLPTSALYLLAKKSTPEAARTVVAAQVEAGRKITFSEVRNTVYGPRRMVGDPSPERLSIRARHDAPAPRLKTLTAEGFQTIRRRQLIDLIVDVARQLPSDWSIKEARAVVVSASAEGKRDRFALAVTTLDEFVSELRRAFKRAHIARHLRQGRRDPAGAAADAATTNGFDDGADQAP